MTDVTWYEASAFAEWKNKKLPSVYEWEKAARYPTNLPVGMILPWGMISEGVDAAERANFLGKGTLPVDSMPFGISPWGAYNMAGNVAEWCSNPKQPGFAFRGRLPREQPRFRSHRHSDQCRAKRRVQHDVWLAGKAGLHRRLRARKLS